MAEEEVTSDEEQTITLTGEELTVPPGAFTYEATDDEIQAALASLENDRPD
jgi:hypothetical protein